ncbi:MAG: L-lysine 2,3-aminomutase [Porticoccaceae bacterium]|jgi:L-lysine 2,3-aminomutase
MSVSSGKIPYHNPLQLLEVKPNGKRELSDCNIAPYCLPLLDPVQCASHFEVNQTKALNIYHELQAILSGFLLPKLAREIPDERYKTPSN